MLIAYKPVKSKNPRCILNDNVGADSFTVFSNTSKAGVPDMDITDTSAVVFGLQCENNAMIVLTPQRGVPGTPSYKITFSNIASTFSYIG